MNLMERRRALMAANCGKRWYSSGIVTQKNNGLLKIEHNLGTTEIALWVWPEENISFDGHSRCWHDNFINWPSVMPNEMTLDFTSYNSKFSTPSIIDPNSQYFSVTMHDLSSLTNQTGWAGYRNTNNYNSLLRRAWTIERNFVTSNYTYSSGTYRWIAIELNIAYNLLPHSTGIVTNASYKKITATHNLGTSQIVFLIFPYNNISATAGYRRYYQAFVNLNDLKPQEIILDFTQYHPSLTTVVVTPSSNASEVQYLASPWTTQSAWYGGSGQVSGSISTITQDENTFITSEMTQGQYKWIAIDVSSITDV